MAMKNKTYDVLKFVTLLLPALGTLYFALSGIWSFPYGEQIVGTLSAIEAFLVAILKISSNNYNGEGTLVINTTDPEKDVYNLELNVPVEELSEKKTIMFKVNSDTKE